MKCPKCGSKKYQSSKRGYVCLDCNLRFMNPISDLMLSENEDALFKPMMLFCFNQQKMTEHRVKERKFKIRTLPDKWECVECGCLNG